MKNNVELNYLFDYIITMRNTKLVKAYKNLKHLKLIQHSLKQYFLRKFLFLKDKYRRWS